MGDNDDIKYLYLTLKQILRYETNTDNIYEFVEAKNAYYKSIKMEQEEKIIINQKPNISFESFISLDIRVCQVLEAERVHKTDKLLKLKLNTGIDERECVTNLGGLYQPEQFIGKKIPFILNLDPTTIKKIESKAMIFIPDTKGDIFNAYNEYEIGDIIFTK